MTITAKVLISPKTAETAQTTQYTATNVTTIIDKFTATNYTATLATLSVNLVEPGGSASSSNVVSVAKAIQPYETYTFPEIVGQTLAPGSMISTICSAATSINIRASGREVT
jgi:hypothetical protein